MPTSKRREGELGLTQGGWENLSIYNRDIQSKVKLLFFLGKPHKKKVTQRADSPLYQSSNTQLTPVSFPAVQALIKQKHPVKIYISLGNSPSLWNSLCCSAAHSSWFVFPLLYFVSHIPTKRCRTSEQRVMLFLQNKTPVCPVFIDISQKHPRSHTDSFWEGLKGCVPVTAFHWEGFHDPFPLRNVDTGLKGQRALLLAMTHPLPAWVLGHAWFLSHNC